MPKTIENIEFDLLDFIEDDPESMEGFKEIINEAVEEWLEVNGYEDWDVEDYEYIDTTIIIKNVSLVPEAELEKEPDEDEEEDELDDEDGPQDDVDFDDKQKLLGNNIQKII